ncbi:MAG: Gfo/Idh/MocA family protein [Spirochaetales bacterium]
MERIRAGVIGVGKIGRAHIEAVKRLGYADVAAIVVRDEARAKELCGRYDIPKYYTDYAGLLADPDIDVVHNCTPNKEHFAINRDCLLAGKAILSEKPLTTSSRDSAELAGLSGARNVKSAVNFVYRHYSAAQLLRAMIGRGELGEIYAIRGEYLQDWLLFETDYDWRVEAALGGPSRAMADIGSHWCDLAQFLLGQDIAEVCADLATFVPSRMAPKTAAFPARRVAVDTEDYGSALLRFGGGTSGPGGAGGASWARGAGEARGSFTVSQVSAGRKTGLSIAIDGSLASARWEHSRPDRLLIGRRDRPEEELFAGAGRPGAAGAEQLGGAAAAVKLSGRAASTGPLSDPCERVPEAQRNMIDSFYRTILYGEAPRYADFEEGHKIVKIMEALLASDKSRRWERV